MGFCGIILKIMKEILIKLFEKYALYRGHGKLAVLFVAALICLIFMHRKHRGRVHPLLFVVSVFTGISAAFSELIEKVFKENKIFYGTISVLFILFAISMSGSRIWSSDFTDDKQTIEEYSDSVESVTEYLLGRCESPKVLADKDITTMLLCYSSKLEPLCRYDGNAKEDELSDAIESQHPPMETITRLANKEGHFFVIIDKRETWPERAAEGKYELINTIGNMDIYEYGGIAHE